MARLTRGILAIVAVAVVGPACGGSPADDRSSRAAEVARIVARDFEASSGKPTSGVCKPGADGWTCTMRVGRDTLMCDEVRVENGELVARSDICVVR